MRKLISMQFCFQACVPETSTEFTAPVMRVRVWILVSSYLSRPTEPGLGAPPSSVREPRQPAGEGLSCCRPIFPSSWSSPASSLEQDSLAKLAHAHSDVAASHALLLSLAWTFDLPKTEAEQHAGETGSRAVIVCLGRVRSDGSD